MKRPIILKDALYNLAKDSGASDEYCRALVVGLIASLMATGTTFANALKQIHNNTPKDARPLDKYIPPSWVEDMEKLNAKKR